MWLRCVWQVGAKWVRETEKDTHTHTHTHTHTKPYCKAISEEDEWVWWLVI